MGMRQATRLKVAASCCLLLFAPALSRAEAKPDAEPFGLIGRVLGAVLSGDKGNKEKDKDNNGDGGDNSVNDGYGAPSSGYGAPSSSYGAPSSGYGVPTDSYGAPSCACRRIFNLFHGGKKRKRKKEMETGVTVVITVIVEDMRHLLLVMVLHLQVMVRRLQVMVVPVATEDFFSCLV